MGYGRVRASRAVDITPPPTPFDTLRYPARVFIYFRGVNERDVAIVRLHRPLVRHPFYDRFAETPFSPAFIPASYNLINQPSYRFYLAPHPPDSSREVTVSRRLSLHQREIPFCILRG